jgi:hypothetical protein
MSEIIKTLYDLTKDAISDLHLENANHRMPYICWKRPNGKNFLALYNEKKRGIWVGIRKDSIPDPILECGNNIY